MKKRLIFLLLLFSLLLSACSNSDEFSGKTFEVSTAKGINEPGEFYPIASLEFSEGHVVKNKMGYEEGTYELQDDKLVIQFEEENESLEIEFTLEESDKDFIAYWVEVSDSDFQIKDSKQVSKYKGLYYKMQNSHFSLIER